MTRSIHRIAIKGALLFAALNLLFAFVDPMPLLSRITIYNGVVAGRKRLPFGENPSRAYNLSLNNLDAMYASHEISRPKANDEYRVMFIGDSSTWGFLLKPEETLAGYLDSLQLRREGKRIRVFNLGYPDFSVTKDLILLKRAMQFKPDKIIWLVTLRSFPLSTQSEHALVKNNNTDYCEVVHAAGDQFRCELPSVNSFAEKIQSRNLFARRREFADWFRLQLYGVLCAATGIDQEYPAKYEPAQRDLERDESFREFQPPTLQRDDLFLDALVAGKNIAGVVPLVVVNEPMLISEGKNNDVRYNFFYPRWAYDQYRVMMRDEAQKQNIRYVDLWNLVPQNEFTNSAVHLTPKGSKQLADELAAIIDDD
jgi:uncharacterized protein YehS (DUF1456 family)